MGQDKKTAEDIELHAKHIGSSFDDFLKKEGLYEEVVAAVHEKIGIKSLEEFKKYTIAIARGEITPKRDDPKMWVDSASTLSEILGVAIDMAGDLHKVGAIDQLRKRKIDVLATDKEDPTEIILADPKFRDSLLKTISQIKLGKTKWHSVEEFIDALGKHWNAKE
jgi:hypothetical protein